MLAHGEIISNVTTALSERFWVEASAEAKRLDLSLATARVIVRCVYGTPPWEAYSEVAKNEIYVSVATRKKEVETILRTDAGKQFANWVAKYGEALFKFDHDDAPWTWSFREATLTLRYIVAVSEESIDRAGLVTQTASNAVLGAVKELNKMYFDPSLAMFHGDLAKSKLLEGEGVLNSKEDSGSITIRFVDATREEVEADPDPLEEREEDDD